MFCSICCSSDQSNILKDGEKKDDDLGSFDGSSSMAAFTIDSNPDVDSTQLIGDSRSTKSV